LMPKAVTRQTKTQTKETRTKAPATNPRLLVAPCGGAWIGWFTRCRTRTKTALSRRVACVVEVQGEPHTICSRRAHGLRHTAQHNITRHATPRHTTQHSVPHNT
jgi:hypothetical protein